MLIYSVTLTWCFIVACACLLGNNRRTQQLEEQNAILITEKTTASHKAEMIFQHFACKDRQYKQFDSVLESLPLHSDDCYPYVYQCLERDDFRIAANLSVTENISDALTVTKIHFTKERLHRDGYTVTAWSRNGWVLVPEHYFKGG